MCRSHERILPREKIEFYRGRNGNLHEWTVVSEDRKAAIGMLMQELVCQNHQTEKYYPKGLNEESIYHFTNRTLKHNIKDFGDLLNNVTPVHIKPNSIGHRILQKVVKLDSEKEDVMASGGELMYAGAALAEAFGGCGYDQRVRHFPDFASRMYVMEEVEAK